MHKKKENEFHTQIVAKEKKVYFFEYTQSSCMIAQAEMYLLNRFFYCRKNNDRKKGRTHIDL